MVHKAALLLLKLPQQQELLSMLRNSFALRAALHHPHRGYVERGPSAAVTTADADAAIGAAATSPYEEEGA